MKQKDQGTRRGRWAGLLFWAYLALLLRITVFRTGFWQGPLFAGGRLSTALFAEYLSLAQNGRWLRFGYLFLGNILWFMPFGFFLVRRRGVRPLRAVLYGFLLSLGIEAMQFVLGTGLSELDDLVLNTAGAALGSRAAVLAGRLCSRSPSISDPPAR